MFDSLGYDGMEVRENGLFGRVNQPCEKEHPELERTLKEIYLNKWYYSQLSVLRGMSPWEASQTEEGTRLLWTLFKRIKKKAAVCISQPTKVHLKEYIRKWSSNLLENHNKIRLTCCEPLHILYR